MPSLSVGGTTLRFLDEFVGAPIADAAGRRDLFETWKCPALARHRYNYTSRLNSLRELERARRFERPTLTLAIGSDAVSSRISFYPANR